jgi:hypothetical protein
VELSGAVYEGEKPPRAATSRLYSNRSDRWNRLDQGGSLLRS